MADMYRKDEWPEDKITTMSPVMEGYGGSMQDTQPAFDGDVPPDPLDYTARKEK